MNDVPSPLGQTVNRRPARWRLAKVGICLGLMMGTLCSCGIPDDDRPREIDPALLENITDQT